jgi:hypothetical protein
MDKKRRVTRVLWLVVPAALGAGTLYGVLALKGDRVTTPREDSEEAATVSKNPSRLAEATKLSRGRGVEDTNKIVKAYGEWASDPSALPERRLLLAALFAEQDMGKKLNGVLAAVEADPTPPEKDPLWERITKQLADLWKGEVATKALDLTLAEKRPRARQAMISSFAEVATSPRLAEFTPDQKQTLTETMIDVSIHVPPAQKAETLRALRALGGNDLADISAGKGIDGKDGHVLESERAYRQALEQTKQQVGQQGNDAAQ